MKIKCKNNTKKIMIDSHMQRNKKGNTGVSEQSQWESQGPACVHERCLSDIFLPELLTEINK